MRARRFTGFTLVELMTVVAIVGIAAALAARLFSRATRGENAPSMARTLMMTMMDAHHQALTLGQPVRVRFTGESGNIKGSISTAQYVANVASPAWVTQSTLALPSGLQLCAPTSGVSFGSVSPTCPLTGTQDICFYANGHVDWPSSGACAISTPSTFSGTTLYLETYSGDKKFRILIWGLTGMVKVIDTW
jgi:prepilin-type N-terminal cleavage/methylation domain-containing protein